MTISESILRQRLDSIFGFYEINGSNEYLGESVSILEHSFQTAQLAENEGFDEDVVLAAFLHDIGHFLPNKNEMNGLGNISHEVAGANFLYKNGFSNRVAQLVRNHVEAKRYLTYKYPTYFEKLSEASRKTLEFQGGKMTEEEAILFEKSPMFDLYLKMREWDDNAKEVDLEDSSIDKYKEIAWRHLSER
ncbi:phosphonate degradation associated HDIG domain protein [Arcicella aurantiaca]|uniref:Phosphonate degradation associated HDIG domain protein n=1 Tax=Arcicella aurantiaca TaxID=591202 RepID=A0A316EWX6_9BACT|nr:HD domain-containing protein [Arcicella aurantiaca]PWK27681.1 phosphonate degradation associated HDIG domain protein [Arcicella aurantiaca]